MPSQQFIGGAAQFWIGGTFYNLGANLKVRPGGLVTKEMATGVSGVAGPVGEWIAPEVDGEIFTDGTLSVSTLQQISGQTVQINSVNGKSYMLYNARVIGALEDDVVGAKMSIKLSGTTCVEQVAS